METACAKSKEESSGNENQFSFIGEQSSAREKQEISQERHRTRSCRPLGTMIWEQSCAKNTLDIA